MNFNIITWNMQGANKNGENPAKLLEKFQFLTSNFFENDDSTADVACLQEVGSPDAYDDMDLTVNGAYEYGSCEIKINGKEYTFFAAWVDTPNLRCGTGILYDKKTLGRASVEMLGDDMGERPYVCLTTRALKLFSVHAVANEATSISQIRALWNKSVGGGQAVVFGCDMNQSPQSAARGTSGFPATLGKTSPNDGMMYAPNAATHNSGHILDFFIVDKSTYNNNQDAEAQAYDCAGLSDHSIVSIMLNIG